MAGGKSLDPHYLLGIVNGDISHMNEWPFMASLLYKSKTHFCGGSVWNSKFILTAAHCLYFDNQTLIPVELITVYVGHVNLVFLHSSSLYAVEIAIAHPKFVGVGGGYDIALIQLKNEINFKSSSSSCVCQLKPHGTYDRSTCYAIGWGATSYENRKPSFFLRHVMLPVLEDSYCSTHSKHYVYNPKNSIMCWI
ncbi:Cytochrome P450 4f11 [Blomia tropicalis]|nr:Cytochrome P450 4f11 [Blomia tropicalis]